MNSWWFISYRIGNNIQGHCTFMVENPIFSLDSIRKALVVEFPNNTADQVAIIFFKELTEEQYRILNLKENG